MILQSITNFLCLHARFEEELDDVRLLDLHGPGTFLVLARKLSAQLSRSFSEGRSTHGAKRPRLC
jgi:hypothetical protein